jgi:hypothetical protein
MITFAQHQLGMGNVQLVVKGSASGVLYTVVGPQDLCAVANIDGLKVLLPMRGRKRLMTLRVPILRQYHVLKFCRQPIDCWYDLVAARHRQIAARAKVILQVDHKKDIAVADR